MSCAEIGANKPRPGRSASGVQRTGETACQPRLLPASAEAWMIRRAIGCSMAPAA